MRGIVAALLLLATPAAAQPDPADQRPAEGAEFLAPTADAHVFFEWLLRHAMTDASVEAIIAAMPAGSSRALDEGIERSFERGEQVADWQNGGIDLRAAIALRDGGLAGNMAEGPSQFGPVFVHYQDWPFDAFVPAEWLLVGRRGEPFAGDNVQVEIGHASPKVILVERIAYRRQGNAYCRMQAESRLYADPDVAASEADMVAVIETMRVLAIADRHSLCALIEEQAPGRYLLRAFDAEGFRLPAYDQVEPFRIVPRSPSPRRPSPRLRSPVV